MASNFNFFSWIREGVRQSVLLGVSDAVENIGTAPDGDDVTQRLVGFVKSGGPGTPKRISGRSSRKKLGRTLDEIQASIEKA